MRIGDADFAKAVLEAMGKPDPLTNTQCHAPQCAVCAELHRDWVREINDLAAAIRKAAAEHGLVI